LLYKQVRNRHRKCPRQAVQNIDGRILFLTLKTPNVTLGNVLATNQPSVLITASQATPLAR
jgi:hypothetical protein